MPLNSADIFVWLPLGPWENKQNECSTRLRVNLNVKFDHAYFSVQTQGVRTYLEANLLVKNSLENLYNTEN